MLGGRLRDLIAGDGDPAQALPGCAWTIIRHHRIAQSGAVGLADPRTHRPLRPTTPMRIASLSKISTSLLVMRLIDARRLSLETDASDVLGFTLRNPAFPDTPIRVRHLISHTSSMRDGEVYWAGLGERIADFFIPGASHWEKGAHWAPDHRPGAYFTYCNLAFGILAAIVEKIEGQRFDLVAHEKLFAPLELECGFNWGECPREFIAQGSPVWRLSPAGWTPQVDDPLPVDRGAVYLNPNNLPLSEYRLGDNGLLFAPQGGLRASGRDLARLGCLLLDNGAPLLSDAIVAQMRTPVWTYDGANGETENGFWRGYGLGLQLIDPGAGSPLPDQRRRLIGHSGDAYGLRGGLWLDMETGAGFSFLFNGGPEDGARASGAHSAFSRPEEAIMQELYARLDN